MASTQNYDIPLPQLGEPADIRVLDQGTEMIDGIMHGNRTMIAPGWVSTETYNTGSRVVYLGEYYKCKADNVTGAWDATKWDKTTVGEDIEGLGTGGASALADLDDVEITSPTEGQALLYDDSDDKWKNGTLPDPSVVKKVTGNPIEITDAAAAPLVKCVTEIQGSQDLHGYDKPWVGGAGKNKVNPNTIQNGYYTTSGYTDDDEYKTSDVIQVTVGQTYAGSIFNTSNLSRRYDTVFATFASGDTTNAIRQVVGQTSITIEEGEAYIRIRNRSDTISLISTGNYAFQLESGSTPTAYAPYSNICPITAYTEGEIEVSDGDGNTTTHTTTYPSAIYRGSEDCVEGSVRADYLLHTFVPSDIYAVYSLATVWRVGINLFVSTIKSCLSSEVTTAISSKFNAISENARGPFYAFYQSNPSNILYFDVPKSDAATEADAKAIIVGSQLAYELATPTTSSVTPTNLPIKTLSGYNHIESSTGDMEVEYISGNYQALVNLIQSSSHVYSTAEQVAGKWIDGSDVYEKSFKIDNISDDSNHVLDATLTQSAITLLPGTEITISCTGTYNTDFINTMSDNTYGRVIANVNGLNASIVGYSYLSSQLGACTLYVTARYLKKSVSRSLSATVNTQKAQIEPLEEKGEETPVEEEKAAETPVEEPKEDPVEEPEENKEEPEVEPDER